MPLSSADLTKMIPERWPYAPPRARIALRDPSTFAGDWGGRWEFTAQIAFINNALPEDQMLGVCAHEMAHGRWSTPLPDMEPGEEGAAALFLGMFDEIRTDYFAVQAHPAVTATLASWTRLRFTTDELKVRNLRGAALAYGYIDGAVRARLMSRLALEAAEAAIDNAVGAAFIVGCHDMVTEALTIRVGETGDLVRAARRWDRWATLGG